MTSDALAAWGPNPFRKDGEARLTRIHRCVALRIGVRALVEEPTETVLGVGGGRSTSEERAVAAVDAFRKRLRWGRQRHQEPFAQCGVAEGSPKHRSSSQGDDVVLCILQARKCDPLFEIAKRGLADLAEKRLDALSGFFLDASIDVDERVWCVARKQGPQGRLACAHGAAEKNGASLRAHGGRT